MSAELNGPVLSVTADFRIDSRVDENGLDADGWRGDAKNQELPVKVLDAQILWSTGHYSYSASFDPETQIDFPLPGMVCISQRAYSGERIFWNFINLERISNAETKEFTKPARQQATESAAD